MLKILRLNITFNRNNLGNNINMLTANDKITCRWSLHLVQQTTSYLVLTNVKKSIRQRVNNAVSNIHTLQITVATFVGHWKIQSKLQHDLIKPSSDIDTKKRRPMLQCILTRWHGKLQKTEQKKKKNDNETG